MNQNVKTKRGFPYATVLLVVLLVLVAAVLLYSIINSFGLFGRLDTAARSQNHKITENELCVYKYHVAQNTLYNMWLYDLYGLTQNKYAATFGTVDAFINYMIPQYLISDPHAFDQDAYAYAEQYLIYREGAEAAGQGFNDEDKNSVKVYMDSLEELAKSNGVSLSTYIHDWIGAGVSKGDVEKAMQTYYVATRYAIAKTSEFSDAVTEDEISKEVQDNQGDYFSTKYTYYALVDNDLAEKAKACKTADDVKRMLVDYYMSQSTAEGTKFDTLYKEQITDKDITDPAGKEATMQNVLTTVLAWEKLTEEKAVFEAPAGDEAETGTTETNDAEKLPADYNEAGYNIATAIDTAAKKEIDKIYTNGSNNYVDPTASSATDLQKWLFDAGRKVDDTTTITTTSTNSDGSTKTTTSWYLVTETMVKDLEKTKKGYYTTLQNDADTVENAQTADQKYAALEANPTAENFESIFHTTLLDSIAKASVATEIGDWLFAEGRKEGDFTRLVVKKTSTGSDGKTQTTNEEYVIFFVGENDENWKVSARNAVTEDKLTAWMDEIRSAYKVTTDYVPEETSTTTAS